MKKILLTIAMTLSIFVCHSQITQVNDMKEVFDAFKEANIRLRQQQFNLQMAKEELNFQAGIDVIK